MWAIAPMVKGKKKLTPPALHLTLHLRSSPHHLEILPAPAAGGGVPVGDEDSLLLWGRGGRRRRLRHARPDPQCCGRRRQPPSVEEPEQFPAAALPRGRAGALLEVRDQGQGRRVVGRGIYGTSRTDGPGWSPRTTTGRCCHAWRTRVGASSSRRPRRKATVGSTGKRAAER